MSVKKALILVLTCALLLGACDYIVLPEEEESLTAAESKGWSAVATSVGKSAAGDLHIDLAILNETANWSAMQAAANEPAVLTAGGKTTSCDTVFVGTGGHRLAPGFRMKGYTGGTKPEPKTQLLYVECKGAEAVPGAVLSLDYSYVTGEYNYYYPDENKTDATMEIALDDVATDLSYPEAVKFEGLVQPTAAEITAINDVILTLPGIERTDNGFQFTWQTNNPGEYPTDVHIGTPPVIGSDGILYGYYQTPDIVSVPVTPAGGTAEWTTQVSAPVDVKGFYIMLSVESKKQRLFVSYAVDISDR
ncbi:MAG: hypothetical protein EHM70_01895 [Chloroflexota bacterium]|nr:MAG: hypothetical protein EHM70_01895 [Chloroflexota bacterium]